MTRGGSQIFNMDEALITSGKRGCCERLFVADHISKIQGLGVKNSSPTLQLPKAAEMDSRDPFCSNRAEHDYSAPWDWSRLI